MKNAIKIAIIAASGVWLYGCGNKKITRGIVFFAAGSRTALDGSVYSPSMIQARGREGHV